MKCTADLQAHDVIYQHFLMLIAQLYLPACTTGSGTFSKKK